jgi:hypothetical protein
MASHSAFSARRWSASWSNFRRIVSTVQVAPSASPRQKSRPAPRKLSSHQVTADCGVFRRSELTVKVVFPASWTDERLTEKGNLGTIDTERLATGQIQLTWHHDCPHAGAYHWLLEGTRAT